MNHPQVVSPFGFAMMGGGGGGSDQSGRFQLKTFPTKVTHSIGHFVAYLSSIALPLIDQLSVQLSVPSLLPACPALRGQPCRPYMPGVNSPALFR